VLPKTLDMVLDRSFVEPSVLGGQLRMHPLRRGLSNRSVARSSRKAWRHVRTADAEVERGGGKCCSTTNSNLSMAGQRCDLSIRPVAELKV
jgi:hypothetical protein